MCAYQLARRLFAADANDAVEKVVSKYLWALLNLVINKSITDGAKLDCMRYYYENGAPLDRTGGEGRFPILWSVDSNRYILVPGRPVIRYWFYVVLYRHLYQQYSTEPNKNI